ncbi:MAG: mannose-6-phosphate isomerase, class I [Melioribacteraceae bacterium]|nr:mannose-6-phosphate isomerase, class I [Melioribacteraceae bacterium]
MIEAKPYKLKNYIQNYEWGTRGKEAFIPKLLGFEGEDKPYAELWIGDHPKLSSEILVDGKLHNLKEVVEKYPNEILGKSIVEKFGSKIPFLLKILSAERALSIQTHPNKMEAVELHKNDSANYPDDNHKPEIAIALNSLSALVGFRDLDVIELNILKYPQLLEFIGDDGFNKFVINKSRDGLRELFSLLMKKSEDVELLKSKIESLIDAINNKSENSEDEKLFLNLYNQYGIDIGLFVLFFLNVVNLNAGEAIYTLAGIPHAYLKGNIVECMANSDNVVRAGLTPKFKDVQQLTKILTYDFGKPKILKENGEKSTTHYLVDFEEFKIEKIKISNNSFSFSTKNKLEIILSVNGECYINDKTLKCGEALLIPALMDMYSINSKSNSTIFRVSIPE